MTKTSCPECTANGGDTKGNNLVPFTDGGGASCFACGYKEFYKDKKVVELLKKPSKNTPLIEGGEARAIDNRGISAITAKFFDYRTAELHGSPAHIANYYDQFGSVIAQKIRKPGKEFFITGNAKQMPLYGQWKWTPNSNVFVTVCYTPDTEVLTPRGWVAFHSLAESDTVMQVDAYGCGSFVRPISYVDKQYTGNLIEFNSGSYKLCTTEDHWYVRKIRGRYERVAPKRYLDRPIPRTVYLEEKRNTEWSDAQIRAMVMFSADFSRNKAGDIKGAFKKERKIQRAQYILDLLNIPYKKSVWSSGMTSFYISRKVDVLEYCKIFDLSLLLSFNHAQIQVLLEELVHWDGNLVSNRAQIEYSSKYLENATSIQTLAHLHGKTSTIIRRSNKFGDWFKVSILLNKTTSSTQNGYKLIPYSGRVMCVNVPSKMLLVRYQESISVCGNCEGEIDALSIAEAQGLNFPVVSVPKGANDAVNSIKQALEWLNGWKHVVIAFDNDEQGREAAKEAVKLFPVGKVRVATWPQKDANDLLVGSANGSQEIKQVIFNAAVPSSVDIIQGGDVSFEEFNALFESGVPLKFPKLNRKLNGLQTGIYTLVARPKAGKSLFTREIVLQLIEQNIKVGVLYLEEKTAKEVGQFWAMENNMPWWKVKNQGTKDESFRKKIFDKLSELNDRGLYFYRHKGAISYTDIRKSMEYLVHGLGCKVIILDNISLVIAGLSDKNERTSIDKFMFELVSFVQQTGVILFNVVHVTKNRTDKDGNDITEVRLADILGSGAYERFSYAVIAMEKVFDQDAVNLKILANRENGENGYCDTLHYNRNSGRLELQKETILPTEVINNA